MAREHRRAADVAVVLDGAERIWTRLCVAVVIVLVMLRGLYSSYRVGGWLLLLAAVVGSGLAVVLLLPAALRRRWSRPALWVLGAYGVAFTVVVGADLLTN